MKGDPVGLFARLGTPYVVDRVSLELYDILKAVCAKVAGKPYRYLRVYDLFQSECAGVYFFTVGVIRRPPQCPASLAHITVNFPLRRRWQRRAVAVSQHPARQ